MREKHMLSQKEAASEAALRVQAAEALALASPLEAGEAADQTALSLAQSSPPIATAATNGAAPLPLPPTFPPPPPPPATGPPLPVAPPAEAVALPPAQNAGALAAFTRAGDVRDSQRANRPAPGTATVIAAGAGGPHHMLLSPNAPDVPLDSSLNNSRNTNTRSPNPSALPSFQQQQPLPPLRAQSYEMAANEPTASLTSAQSLRGAPPALTSSTIGARNNGGGANNSPGAAGEYGAGAGARQSSSAQSSKQLPPLPQTGGAANSTGANHNAGAGAQNRREKQTHCCAIS